MNSKIILVIGGLMLTLVLAGCSSATDQPTSKVNQSIKAYNDGGANVKIGKYQEAITDYDKVIALDPNDTDAYYNRGLTKDYLQRYEEAIADYDKAISLEPNAADAYNNRGISYETLGLDKLANQDFAKAKELGYGN